MGMFDDLKDLVSANQQKKADAKTAKEARHSRQQGLDLVGNMNWEPELSSDHIAPYQRSQSPVADAFLEMFGGDTLDDLQASVDRYRRRIETRSPKHS